MRKYLREQQFFENIKNEDIDKTLNFLLDTVQSAGEYDKKLMRFQNDDEESIDKFIQA